MRSPNKVNDGIALTRHLETLSTGSNKVHTVDRQEDNYGILVNMVMSSS
jgi:hypothetical protein